MSSVHKSTGPHYFIEIKVSSPQVLRSKWDYSSTGPPSWFKNQAQLSTHLWRTCLQRIFQIFFQLATNGDYMLAKIVGSSFSAGERSE